MCSSRLLQKKRSISAFDLYAIRIKKILTASIKTRDDTDLKFEEVASSSRRGRARKNIQTIVVKEFGQSLRNQTDRRYSVSF
jgi:hypothetical protein